MNKKNTCIFIYLFSPFTANYGIPVEFSITCWIAQYGIQFGQQIILVLNLNHVITQV